MKVKPCPSHGPWGGQNGMESRDIFEVKLSYFMTSWMNQKVEQVFRSWLDDILSVRSPCVGK